MNMIEVIDFIDYVCDVLEVELPKIEMKNNSNRDKFPTDTAIAILVADEEVKDNTIYINGNVGQLDLFFSIAHELRHLYQLVYYREWLENYKTSDTCSIEDYNLQHVEIDANAFAKIMIEDEFGVSPLFNNLPKNVIDRINERAREILKEFE